MSQTVRAVNVIKNNLQRQKKKLPLSFFYGLVFKNVRVTGLKIVFTLHLSSEMKVLSGSHFLFSVKYVGQTVPLSQSFRPLHRRRDLFPLNPFFSTN